MEEMVKNELEFYSKFVRPLIFNLPESTDRVLAASWVKKIKDENAGAIKLRTDYMKLLLFALQRRKLAGIFADDPSKYEKLDEFPEEYDLNEMARKLIEKEHADRQDRIRRQLRGQEGDFPPYTTDFSSDFREYVAAQDIPGFGVHCFYAISKDPISAWQNVDKSILPKVAKSVVDSSTPMPLGVSARLSDPTFGADEKDKEDVTKSGQKTPESAKKKKSRKFGKQPPASPLGKVAAPEEREPPSWGTNLVEVKDIPKFEEFDTRESFTPSPRSKERIESPRVSTKIEQYDVDEEPRGAIPKGKGAVRIPGADETVIEDIENTLQDFMKGEISASSRRRRPDSESVQEVMPQTPPRRTESPGYTGTPFQDMAGALVPRDEYVSPEEEDPDKLRRQLEIAEDEEVIEHFRRQLKQAGARQKISEVTELIQSSLPAKADIPVTTPRISPSPRRPKSPEKLLEEPVSLPSVGDVTPSEDKDASMYKVYLEAQAVAEPVEELSEVEPEQEFGYDQQISAQQEDEVREPDLPIQPGSPAANAILAEYAASKEEEPEPPHDPMLDDLQFLPLSPSKPGLETPPLFSRDARMRAQAMEMEYPGSSVEDVRWQDAPEYFEQPQDEGWESPLPGTERRHLLPQELARIPKRKELTDEERMMMKDPMLRRQLFFETEVPPEEFEDLYDMDVEQAKRARHMQDLRRQVADIQALEDAQRTPPPPTDEYGLPLFADYRYSPVKLSPVQMRPIERPPPANIEELKRMEESPVHELTLMDLPPPSGLQVPMDRTNTIIPGYTTPPHLKSKRIPHVPKFMVEMPKSPCDTECGLFGKRDITQMSPSIFDSPPDLLPPTPPHFSPPSDSEFRSPPPMSKRFLESLAKRQQELSFQQDEPSQRPMLPALGRTMMMSTPYLPPSEGMPPQMMPESPSFFTAEPGSPALLEQLSPEQIYEAQNVEDDLLDLEGIQFGDFLEQEGELPAEVSRYVGAEGLDVGHYLTDAAPPDFMDIAFHAAAAAADIDDDLMLYESPPESPVVYSETQEHLMKLFHQAGEELQAQFNADRRQRLLEPRRKAMPASERKYVQRLFANDPETSNFILSLGAHIADVEQEVPDPTDMFQDDDVDLPVMEGEADLFGEQFPEEEYLSLPPSPERTSAQPSPGILDSSGEGSLGILSPCELGTCGFPSPTDEQPFSIPSPVAAGPSRIPSPGVAGPSRIPSPGGARPSGIPGPGGARPSGIPGPGGARPSGIPGPGGARPSGIPGPGGARPSGIPGPGGARPSGIPGRGAARPSGIPGRGGPGRGGPGRGGPGRGGPGRGGPGRGGPGRGGPGRGGPGRGGPRRGGIPAPGVARPVRAPSPQPPSPLQLPAEEHAPCVPCTEGRSPLQRSPERIAAPVSPPGMPTPMLRVQLPTPPRIMITATTPDRLAEQQEADIFAQTFGGGEFDDGIDVLMETPPELADVPDEDDSGPSPFDYNRYDPDAITVTQMLMERKRVINKILEPKPRRKPPWEVEPIELEEEEEVVPTLYDSPIPQDLPVPMQPQVRFPGWVTPPHIREALRRQAPAQARTEPPRLAPWQRMQLMEQMGDVDTVPHDLQVQLAQATPAHFLDETDAAFLMDDAEFPDSYSPLPCVPCTTGPSRSPSPPPYIPSSPPYIPSPESPSAADVFLQSGIQFSPESVALTRRAALIPRRLEFSDSPERVVTRRNTQQRYALQRRRLDFS